MPGSIAAAGSSFHWNDSPVQHSGLLWKSSAEKGSLETQIQVAAHPAARGKKSAAGKKASSQSFSFCRCFKSSELILGCSRRKGKSRRNSIKKKKKKHKDGASLFSSVKRKYPFGDIYIQVMAGGKWPVFCGGRSVHWWSAWPKSPHNSQIHKEAQLSSVWTQITTWGTLQIISGSFDLTCLCFGVFVVFLNFWRMDNAVLLLSALVILNVSLKG